MLKQNDVMQADYNDEEGKVEIDEDEIVFTGKENTEYSMKQQQEQAALTAAQPVMDQQSAV